MDERQFIIKTQDVDFKVNTKGLGHEIFECMKKHSNKIMQVNKYAAALIKKFFSN